MARFFNIHLQDALNLNCRWVKAWVTSDNTGFRNERKSLAKFMAEELGSRDRQHLAAVFMSEPNTIKGRLWTGHTGVKRERFDAMEVGDEQLMQMRDLGLAFSYMNNAEVWDAFCETYNAMRFILQDFDAWFPNQPGGSRIDLSGEWRQFVRAELQRVAEAGRADAFYMYNNHKQGRGLMKLWVEARWFPKLFPVESVEPSEEYQVGQIVCKSPIGPCMVNNVLDICSRYTLAMRTLFSQEL
jgi:hypothetical protein